MCNNPIQVPPEPGPSCRRDRSRTTNHPGTQSDHRRPDSSPPSGRRWGTPTDRRRLTAEIWPPWPWRSRPGRGRIPPGPQGRRRRTYRPWLASQLPVCGRRDAGSIGPDERRLGAVTCKGAPARLRLLVSTVLASVVTRTTSGLLVVESCSGSGGIRILACAHIDVLGWVEASAVLRKEHTDLPVGPDAVALS